MVLASLPGVTDDAWVDDVLLLSDYQDTAFCTPILVTPKRRSFLYRLPIPILLTVRLAV